MQSHPPSPHLGLGTVAAPSPRPRYSRCPPPHLGVSTVAAAPAGEVAVIDALLVSAAVEVVHQEDAGAEAGVGDHLVTAAAVWSVTGLLQSVYFQKRTVRSPHSSSLRTGNANVPIKNRSKVFQRHLLLTSLVSTHLGGAERVAQVATYDVTTHLGGAERVAQVATYDVTIHLGGAERVAQVATYDVTPLTSEAPSG